MIDKRFKGFDNFLFDLDGTLWLWTELLPRVDKVMKILEELEKNIFFITNNCLLTRTGFARKLQGNFTKNWWLIGTEMCYNKGQQ